MKRVAAVLWLLALAGAYGLGARGVASSVPGPAAVGTLESALDHHNPLVRSFEVSRFLRSLDAESVDAAIEVVEAESFWFDQQEHQLLMAAWVPIDSLTAVDWASERPGLLKRRARIAAVEALGFHDPTEARAVLTSIDSPERLELLHAHMAQGWARSDRKDEFSSYLMRLSPGNARQRATSVFVNEILKSGPEALIAWVDGIPDEANDNLKWPAFQKAVNSMVRIDPARAARWIDSHRDDRYAANAPKLVALRWAERDPVAALDWLATLPEQFDRTEQVKKTFTVWMEVDPRAAESWVRSAAPALGVDSAVRVLVRRYFDTRPAYAMEWSSLIEDPKQRLRVQTMAGNAWFKTDRDAFMEWLPESGLDKQVRDLILNAPRKGLPDRVKNQRVKI